MKRVWLACSAVLISFLSGCCGCGAHTNPCCNPCGYGGTSYGGYQSSYLPTYDGGYQTVPDPGSCSGCAGDGGYALPPAPSTPAPQAAFPNPSPAYTYAPGPHYPGYNYPPGAIPVGPETVGPEIVTGPAYVPADSSWTYQASPTYSTGTLPTPAPFATSGTPTAVLPPAPIPNISNGTVVPPPSPAATATQPPSSAGPMMPPVPPPPTEPVSQMRFRQYR